MRPLSYSRARDGRSDALALAAGTPASAFLAGGTTEVDLIRAGISRLRHLVDINDLPLRGVEDLPDGGLRIGALARMSDVARDPAVVERFPAISQALLLGASQQLRNMASMGGNLLQRTRCAYLRDGISPCNKREPGSGCAALEGFNRGHAILGTSEHCIATHPSDLAVALAAFDAVVQTVSRTASAHRVRGLLPAPRRHARSVEHPLGRDELIVGIEVPGAPIARHSVYLKFRDRQSYEFALVSVAAALEIDDGVVTDARLALGGVATKPWRARLAEAALIGGPADETAFRLAAGAELEERGRAPAQRVQGRARERAPPSARSSRLDGRRHDAPSAPRSRASTGRPRSRAPRATRPRSRCRGWRTSPSSARRSRAAASTAIDADARGLPTASSPSSATRTCHRSQRSRTCCPRCSGRPRPARASSRCRTTSSTTPASRWRWSSPRPMSARSTPPRWCASRTRPRPSITTIDEGRDEAYEAERLFGGLMPGTQRARRRRRGARARPTCASTSP